MSSLIIDKNNPGGRYTTAAQTPIPEVPAAPSTLREAAYRAQADQYLTAYTGYMLEGRTAEAGEQKALYLAAKAAIREQYPDTPHE